MSVVIDRRDLDTQRRLGSIGAGPLDAFNGRKLLVAPDAHHVDFLVLQLTDSDAGSFLDDSGGPGFAVSRETEQRESREIAAGLEFGHEISSDLEYRVRLGYFHREEDITSPGVAPAVRDRFGIPPNSSDSIFRRFELDLESKLNLSDNLRVSAGAQVQYEDGASDSRIHFETTVVPGRFDLDRSTYAPFAEARFDADGLVLVGEARLDVPEGFDEELSPRIGMLYDLETSQAPHSVSSPGCVCA